MRQFINTRNVLILTWLITTFVGGLVFGIKIGYEDGARNTTEIRNQMLDIKPYDASLGIRDLEYSNISPAGFTIMFNTNKTTGSTIYGDDVFDLACEWTVYPSDVFSLTPIKIQVFGKPALKADIETYPEGGTVAFRIIAEERNYGSIWYYINLPRPNKGTVLPPPYRN